ncbi:hypothetical protein FRC19_009668, partial [Serendipita sp. 401]
MIAIRQALLLLAAFTVSTFADDKDTHLAAKRHHHELAARYNTLRSESQALEKRDFSGVATWYDVTTGQGYCGGYRSPGDYVVALNQPQMDAQSVRCGDTITISANGRTATAVVWDECPPCAWGSLDLSAGLFQYFNDLGVGVFPITWWTGGDSQPQPQPTSTQPAWTPDPTPTSTWQPPTSSSSSSGQATSSSSSSSSNGGNSDGGSNTIQDVPES